MFVCVRKRRRRRRRRRRKKKSFRRIKIMITR